MTLLLEITYRLGAPRAVAALLLTMSILTGARADVYFVDSELGDDRYTGLTTLPSIKPPLTGPWRTLARVAAAGLFAGDEVRLRCGQSWAETLRLNQSGSSAHPIIISTFPESCSNQPLITGTTAIPADNWELDHNHVYRARLPLNLVGNGALKTSIGKWSHSSAGPGGKLNFAKICPRNIKGCLSYVSPGKVKGLIASPRFTLRRGGRYKLEYSLSAPKGVTVILRVRRSGSTSASLLGPVVKLVGKGFLQTGTVTFAARTSASDARIDVEIPAGGTQVFMRDIALRPLTGAPHTLIMAGRDLQPAHHPNFGFDPTTPDSLYLKNAVDSTVVPDNLTGGSGSNFFTTGGDLVLPPGAELTTGLGVRLRSENWNVDQRTVTAISGSRVDFAPLSRYPIQKDWGYFFTGAAWMVDSADEWFYAATTNLLTVQMPDGGHPGSRLAYATLGAGIDLDDLHDVLVDNLAISGAVTGVTLDSASNITLRRLRIEDTAGRGASLPRGTLIAIEDCRFTRTGLDAISACSAGPLNCGALNSVNGTTVIDSGVQLANGKVVSLPAPLDSAFGLGRDGTVTHSKLLRAGAYGVLANGAYTVNGTSFKDICLTHDDCAAIYSNMFANGSHFSGNLVRGIWGNTAGTPYTDTRAVGIYIDERGQGITVANNLIMLADNGVQVHNAFNNTLRGNTLYGNRRAQLWFQEGTRVLRANGDIHANTIDGNILVPTDSSAAVRQETVFADTDDFGSYTSNIYSTLLGTEVVSDLSLAGSTNYEFATWQAATSNSTPRNSDALGRAVILDGFTTFRVVGHDLVPNGNLANGLTDWTHFNATPPLAEITLENCNPGACVKLAAGGSISLVSSPNFSAVKVQWYRISFDAKTGVDGETFTVTPRTAEVARTISQVY